MFLWVKWPSLTLWGIISSYQGGIQADSVDSGQTQMGNLFLFFLNKCYLQIKIKIACLPNTEKT